MLYNSVLFSIHENFAFVYYTVSPVIAYTNPYLDVVEGSEVDLSCVIIQGNPSPTVHWQKNSKVRNSVINRSLSLGLKHCIHAYSNECFLLAFSAEKQEHLFVIALKYKNLYS